MANCKFGLNDHKPFISKKSVHHHHHDKSNHNFIEKEQYIHSHDHEEHVHNHHEHRGTDKKVLKWALSITLITMFLEIFYGFLSNSLALISDAIHMFTHSFALIVSLLAIIIASKTAPISKTFGYYRAEVLAAFINGITIVLSIIWIIDEAIERFLNPQIIDIKTAMIVTIIGLFVNIITGFILMQGDKDNINLKSAIDVLKNSINTLLESSLVDVKEVHAYIEKNEKVLELHDIHIWEITQDMYNMTAHIKIDKKDLENYEEILHQINHNLKEKFKIVHTTFQFEW